MMNYVALDLETTGLRPENNDIIEIGAVKFRVSKRRSIPRHHSQR